MKSRYIALVAAVTLSVAALHLPAQNAATAPATGAATTIHHDLIDLAKTHQTLDHFGASDAWSMQKIGGWTEANREKVSTLLFSKTEGIGLTCWRFNVGGGIVTNREVIKNPWRTAETFETAEGQYDWTKQANERRVLADAKAMGVPIFVAFVNSPPGRMTVNGFTNSWEPPQPPAAAQSAAQAATQPLTAGNATTNLKPGYEKQFSRYLVDILEHFRTNPDESQRINFTWVSPINEPTVDWNSGQEGSRYSNDDIKRTARALHDELTTRQSPTKMLLVEAPTYGAMDNRPAQKHNAQYGNFVDVLLGDKDFVPLLSDVLCHHAYGSDDLTKNLLQDRQGFARKMAAHKDTGVSSWMSEYCVLNAKRDLTMGYAITVARVMWADLTISGDSAWDWWLAMSDGDYKDGLLYTNWHKPGDAETIIVPKMFWAFGNYSRFIKPGMVRVELTGDHHDLQGLEASAWLDKTNNHVVAVYINAGDAAQKLDLAAQGGPAPKQWTPYITSDTKGDDLRKMDPVAAGKTFDLPAHSIVTLVGE